MRLTLRTLLAYLDHTLDPADAGKLEEKVQTSTIASSLVSRIQGVLRTRTVGAPAPDAAAPNDDANTVAEYLDSTLAPELTADIERRCLESDAHLAEVAASHRVLAAALAEPTSVPSELRRRIYELKPEGLEGTASGGNGSLVSSGTPVTPVGPEDSGVSDATSRLSDEPDLGATLAAASKSIRKSRRAERKAADVATASASTAGQAMAGSKSRQRLEAIEPMLSGGRPSRVVPWLVSLALAAAFLFVLTRAFEPMLVGRRDAEEQEMGTKADEDSEPSDPNIRLVPEATGSSKPRRDVKPNVSSDSANSQGTSPAKPVVTSPVTPPALDNSKTDGESEQNNGTEKPVVAGRIDGTGESREPATSTAANEPIEEVTEVTEVTKENQDPELGPPKLFDPASLLDSVTKSDASNEQAGGSSAVIGGVQSHGGLLLTQLADPQTDAGQWSQIEPDAEIVDGQVIYCPPAYRSRLVLDGGVEMTLVGPVSVRVERKKELGGLLGLTIDHGRVALMTTGAPTSVWMANPVVTGYVELASSGAMAAMEVRHRRLPGRTIEHSSWKTDLRIDSIAGKVQLRLVDDADPGNDAVMKLGVGQQLRQTFGQSAEVRTVPSSPLWIDAEDESAADEEAKETLAKLVDSEQPVELSLIRAVDYRDVKVVGLAARTLANMGVVYQFFGTADDIGPTGLLNQPQQKANWPELVRSLQNLFDRGESAAESIAYVATLREGEADAAKLIRMLQGFTPDDLKSGDAAILVAFLDDPKLSVRVMAIEILRQITGETLEYKPEAETANQRRAAINRWKNYVREDRVKYRTEP